jgi:hypothetical protein
MIVLLASLAASSSTVMAQPQLEPWSYLVGHCWVGQAPGNGGNDRHCFESVFGGQHVRDRHAVTTGGREVYAGETIYSVQGAKVIFTYWNSLGGLGTGEAVFDTGEWRFTGRIHATSAGAEQPFSVTWRKADGGYEVSDGAGTKPRLFKRVD